jgi:hypothetical protein
MLTAYFDESYAAKGYMVVSGWIATIEEWERFEIDWKLFLASYKVPYFHMKEFAQSVGPYKKWKDTKYFRARFINEAHGIIQQHVCEGFVCCVSDEEWQWANRFYYLRETFPSTYAVAGRACIDWAERFAQKSQVECIFDDGGPDKTGLLRAADVPPKAVNPIFKPSHDVPHRKLGTRRGMVQIQAADFLAYEISKYIKDVLSIVGTTKVVKARESLRMFGAKAPRTLFFDRRKLTAFCLHFNVGRRNVVEHDSNAKGQTPQ